MAMATATLLRLSPLRPITTVHLPLRLRPTTAIPSRVATIISMSRRDGSTVPATDRLISAAAYALPFLNALHYGRFLYARVPPVAAAITPILPFAAAYRSLPYAAFVAFFAIYIFVVRNPRMSRYVRYNAMQAVVLDVLLAVPVLAQRVLGTPSSGVGLRVMELGYDLLFIAAAGCFVYGLVSSVLGRTPRLPIVASAAERQL